MMAVSFWPYESQLYPLIDAAGMKDQYSLKKRFELCSGHFVEVSIFTFDKSPLNLHHVIGSTNIGFRANFWSGDRPWFRVDNDNGFLHLHVESGQQPFQLHQQLPDKLSISGCVSLAFDEAEKMFQWKYAQDKTS